MIAHNSLYQERLDKEQITNKIYNLFTQPDYGDHIDTIAEDDLAKRINQILVVEEMP